MERNQWSQMTPTTNLGYKHNSTTKQLKNNKEQNKKKQKGSDSDLAKEEVRRRGVASSGTKERLKTRYRFSGQFSWTAAAQASIRLGGPVCCQWHRSRRESQSRVQNWQCGGIGGPRFRGHRSRLTRCARWGYLGGKAARGARFPSGRSPCQ